MRASPSLPPSGNAGGSLFAPNPSTTEPSESAQAGHSQQRNLLPWTLLLLAALAVAMAWVSHERWWPAPTLTVLRALPLAEAGSHDLGQASATSKQWIPASGWMVAWPQMYSASSLVSGSIEQLAVRPGQEVEQGQLIAVLDSQAAEIALNTALAAEAGATAAVAVAKHNITRAEAAVRQHYARGRQAEHKHRAVLLQLERVRAGGPSMSQSLREDLTLEVAAAQAAVDAAHAALASAESQHEIALAEHSVAQAELEQLHKHTRLRQWQVDQHRIYSPIDGVVASILAQPGQWLHVDEESEGASVVHLYHPQELAAVVDVPLSSVSGIEIGSVASIRSDALGQRQLAGQVIAMEGKADRSRGTLRLYLGLEEAAPALLRPDMLIRARIVSAGASDDEGQTASHRNGASDLTTIPLFAEANADTFSWWKVDATNRLRAVQLEIVQRHHSHAVVRGLVAGDLILAEAWPQAREGLRIRPQPKDEP